MKILAIDTSTIACSAALYLDGTITSFYKIAPRLHGELLLSMIDELLKGSSLHLRDLDALAYGAGPGSFTGVRLAASHIQGLAFGAEKPVIGISSLKAMAYGVYRQLGYTHIACAFDARMQEVYWGLYQFQNGEWELMGTEEVLSPGQISNLPPGDWIGVGDGWETYAEILCKKSGVSRYFPRCYPNASNIAELAVPIFEHGDAIEPALALPTYLRNNVV